MAAHSACETTANSTHHAALSVSFWAAWLESLLGILRGILLLRRKGLLSVGMLVLIRRALLLLLLVPVPGRGWRAVVRGRFPLALIRVRVVSAVLTHGVLRVVERSALLGGR